MTSKCTVTRTKLTSGDFTLRTVDEHIEIRSHYNLHQNSLVDSEKKTFFAKKKSLAVPKKKVKNVINFSTEIYCNKT